jgi:hypothetical protein
VVAVFVRALVFACVVEAVALVGSTSVVLADRFDQAASATSTPTPSGPTATPIACTTAPVGIQIILENPSPGDTLLSGTQVVMNGIAYDTGSTSGPGISSVTIYLGARDQGGLALGTALLGQPNPTVPPDSPYASAGFSLRTPALPSGSGARSIFVYARSLVGNAEAVLEVPVFLNVAPTPVRGQVPTAVVPTPPACTPTPTPTATVEPTATPFVLPTLLPTATPFAPRVPTPTPVSPAAPLPAAAPSTAPPTATRAAVATATVGAVAAVAPATAQAAAPRGGGMPAGLGPIVLAAGVLIVGSGLALRRRQR